MIELTPYEPKLVAPLAEGWDSRSGFGGFVEFSRAHIVQRWERELVRMPTVLELATAEQLDRIASLVRALTAAFAGKWIAL